MNHFEYKDQELFCEEVPMAAIASAVGTPAYVYSRATLVRHFQAFDRAFKDTPHLVCFSAKSNSNMAVLSVLADQGAGLDIVSGGELFRGLKAGVEARKIVYSGVGKTVNEIDYALASDILMFNVESGQELEAINQRAKEMGKTASVSLRINPDVDPQTHPYISTGLKKNKFGISQDVGLTAYKAAQAMSHVTVAGIDFHIGSQLTKTGPFQEAVEKVLVLYRELVQEGITPKYLDIGGGLGIPYDDEDPPPPAEYAKVIQKVLGDTPLSIILEPGRAIVGNAGVLMCRVQYTKEGPGKTFLIVDAGMNDLLRPSIYQAFHAIQPVVKKAGEPFMADVVGPICESGDFLAKDRQVDFMEPGDLLCAMSAGAYGFTMSSNYNSRPKAVEVMVDGEGFQIVRQRETYEDLVRGESRFEPGLQAPQGGLCTKAD